MVMGVSLLARLEMRRFDPSVFILARDCHRSNTPPSQARQARPSMPHAAGDPGGPGKIRALIWPTVDAGPTTGRKSRPARILPPDA